jgi:hypothetical protein
MKFHLNAAEEPHHWLARTVHQAGYDYVRVLFAPYMASQSAMITV